MHDTSTRNRLCDPELQKHNDLFEWLPEVQQKPTLPGANRRLDVIARSRSISLFFQFDWQKKKTVKLVLVFEQLFVEYFRTKFRKSLCGSNSTRVFWVKHEQAQLNRLGMQSGIKKASINCSSAGENPIVDFDPTKHLRFQQLKNL